jgi:GrpB-like predicted nucleotidyltransferase (UPF0157 family)
MSDQPITLVDHNSSWHERFLTEQAVLLRLLQPWLAAAPEHVGSTSVPCLRAKPIIDILAPVHSLEHAQAAVPVLERNGWLFWADDPNRSYRLWFLRPTPASRTHHLQIMQHDHDEVRKVLLFRDALRNDRVLRQEYVALKQRLAERHHLDRNAYTDAKSEFVRSVLRAAGASPSSRRDISASAEIHRETR